MLFINKQSLGETKLKFHFPIYSFQHPHQPLKSKDINITPKSKSVKIRIYHSRALWLMQNQQLKFNGSAVMWNTNQVCNLFIRFFWIAEWKADGLERGSNVCLGLCLCVCNLLEKYLRKFIFRAMVENGFVVGCCFHSTVTHKILGWDWFWFSIEKCNVEWIWRD